MKCSPPATRQTACDKPSCAGTVVMPGRLREMARAGADISLLTAYVTGGNEFPGGNRGWRRSLSRRMWPGLRRQLAPGPSGARALVASPLYRVTGPRVSLVPKFPCPSFIPAATSRTGPSARGRRGRYAGPGQGTPISKAKRRQAPQQQRRHRLRCRRCRRTPSAERCSGWPR
jgi:hypothetical protein